MVAQLNLADFAAWRDGGQDAAGSIKPEALPVVLDVREPWELQTASVKPHGFELIHIPMREVPSRLAELQGRFGPDYPIGCLCHHGMRSMQVASFLAQSGFSEVVNLQGGIDAWSQQVDASVPVY